MEPCLRQRLTAFFSGGLRRQAYWHLALTILIAAVIILLAASWTLSNIRERDLALQQNQLLEHYSAVLPRREIAWSTAAKQAQSRLEYLRFLEEPDAIAQPKLTAYLNAQWTLSEFSNLLILDGGNQVIFHHGSESDSLKSLFGEQATWIYVPQFHQLYRVFQFPIWLGPRGEGRLILFKSLSNSTLREIVIPQAHLQLSYHGQLVAQSHDTPPPSGENTLRIELPWSDGQAASELAAGPMLEIYREVVDQLPYSSFILRTGSAIALLTLLIWLSVGRWLARTAYRIETLGKGARLYAEGETREALVAELEPARQNADEIGETAAAFEQMMETIQSRAQEQQYYLETLSLLEEAVVELSVAGIILRASPGWNKIVHRKDAIGVSIFEDIHAEDVEMLQTQLNTLFAGEKQQISLRFRLRPQWVVKHETWVECQLLPNTHKNGKVTGIRGVLRDITQTYLNERQITHMALHDALTELPNRILLEDRIKNALSIAERNRHLVGVCFIDLDNFKVINDTLGHKAGDRLLVTFAERLRASLRSGDTLARWGGDEFVLLLPDMQSMHAIRNVTEKIVQSLQPPLILDGNEIRVTFSMGAVVYPSDGVDIEVLFSQADRAMFFAKSQGRNQVCYFQDMERSEPGRRELYIQSHLTLAVNQGKIETWFQPIVDARSGKCHAAEVLARWHDGEYGWVSPSTFIPMAESLGLIGELGLHIMKSSLDAAQVWHARGEKVALAVNISKRQLFTPSFTQHLLREFDERGLEHSMLVLEVTESVALSDVQNGAERVTELRKAGFGIAIDDFGTGYSSLSQLHEMRADELKIDISFVRRLDEPSGRSMVQAIINLAQLFGLKTVAEGVEDAATAQKLRDLGVDYLQGYWFGKPMPQAEFLAWLETRSR
ncbi:EAL domain-containing protein [Thiobacillus sp.]|uniref:putative bifunctional diguanylate cyclase/phosphodiesterase n=1 Tax=Thiobacillus sp. TaxID=924 RepID=UPI0025D48632|nr:EAL domain-containing protein [Thiobacillus sp.]MBT9540872.1 EAL domain-containing protein [Thiobacillus sp.]